MRHGKTINHLGRMAAHRDALLQNLAVSLIMNKRINTTLAKAKALRRFVEPIITRSKDDSMHNRRTAFTYLQDKHAVKELFASIGDKVANRPGGYTRIIRTGFRLGDAAEMCMIELVDFNEFMLADSQTKKAKTRRSRSGKKSSDSSHSNAPASSTSAPLVETAAVLGATTALEEEDVHVPHDSNDAQSEAHLSASDEVQNSDAWEAASEVEPMSSDDSDAASSGDAGSTDASADDTENA